MQRAEWLLVERDDVVAEGRREAERIIEDAHDERARLIGETQVHQAAVAEATRVREEAEAEARQMRQEVDDYVDTKLANFEVVLEKTLTAVRRGRDKLSGRSTVGDLEEFPAEDPGHDPFGTEHHS
jgi:F0F1-type ATP synthase membrane subunit b/b'